MSQSVPRASLDSMPEDLAKYLDETKVRRLGYLGEFFQVTAANPELLSTFMAFTDAFGRALPKNLVEVGALTVAGWMDNAYERNQHERLCEKLGFARDWIKAVNRLAPAEDSPLSAEERASQTYILAALARKGRGVDEEFQALIAAVGPARAVAVAMLAGRYVTHALVVNTLALEPPVESIFEKSAR